MPRINRRPKKKSAGYTDEHVEYLRTGFFMFSIGPFGTTRRGGETDLEAVREAWNIMRDKLLADWIRERPGTRPWAWWKFDAQERRQRTDGVVHPFDDRLRRQYVERAAIKNPSFKATAYELFFGRPRCMIPRYDFGVPYEGELAYLNRLDLLTEAERRELL